MDFFHKLLLSHIGFGEIAGFLFLVIAIEVFNRSERGLARAKVLSAIGAISALLSWCVGGYYYFVHYGNAVKPIIIA
jgi:hypothetical protein